MTVRLATIGVALLLTLAPAKIFSQLPPPPPPPPPPGSASLSVSTSALTYNYQIGTTVPGAQSFSASISTGTANFSAQSNATWLEISPSSGTLGVSTTSFSVTVSPSGLGASTYTGGITLTASGVSGSPLTVTVTLNITNAPPSTPSLSVSTNSLSFAYQIGSNVPNGQFFTAFVSSGSANFTASSSATAWLQVSPTGGTLGTSTTQFTVMVNTSGLAANTYTGSVTISAPSASPTSHTVAVTLVVTNQPPASPALIVNSGGTLFFNYQIGSALPGAQGVSVSSTGAALSWSATSSSPSWLQVSPASGTATTSPATINVSVSPSGLAANTYTGSVSFSATGASNGTQVVNVTLTITSPSVNSSLIVNGGPLAFSYQIGSGTPTARTLSASLSAGTGAFSASSSASWLQISPTSGTLSTSASVLTVTVNPTGLAASTYNGTIAVSAPGALGSPLSVYVTLTVTTAPLTPTLTISGGPLTFNYQIGSSAPAAQSLFASLNTGTVAFTASSNSSWLQVTPTSGTMTASGTALSVSVNVAGFTSSGTYNGALSVSTPGVSNSPQTVAVALIVTSTNSQLLPLFTNGPIPDQCQAFTPATQFTNDVQQIYAWVQFTGAQIGDQVTWDWYDPSQAKQTFLYTIPFTGNGCAWASLLVAGTTNISELGIWQVNYLYNGSLQSSNSFQLIPVTPPASTQLQCSASVPSTPTVSASSSSAQVGDLLINCSGGVGGGQAVINLSGYLNVSVASLANTLLLIDEPAPSARVVGLNAFSAVGLGSNGFSFSNVTISIPGANASRFLRVTGLQVNASGTNGQVPQITAVLTMSGNVSIQLPTSELVVASVQSQNQVTISGTIRTLLGQVLAGVGLSFTNGPTVVSDGRGQYSATVSYGYTGTVIPSLVGYSFTPGSRSYGGTGVTTDVTGEDFVGAPTASVQVNPTSLSYSVQLGDSTPAVRTVTVTSVGNSVDFTVSATTNNGGSWLYAGPASGTTPSSLSVSVTPAGLSAGTYIGSIAVAAPGASNSPQAVSVTLTVASVSVSPSVSAVANAASYSSEVFDLKPTSRGPGLFVKSGDGHHSGTA